MSDAGDRELLAAFRKWLAGEFAPAHRTGVMIPLYVNPDSSSGIAKWDLVRDAARRHPTVPVAMVLSNNGGRAINHSMAAKIPEMLQAGVRLLGYVHTRYASEPIAAVEANIQNWLTFYANANGPQVRGIFLDTQSNVAGNEGYYRRLTDFAKRGGADLVVGNPGTQTIPSYVGTVDTMFIAEGQRYPDLSVVQGWRLNHAPSNWSLLGYGVPLDVPKIQSYKPYAGWIYFTDDVLPNPWDSVSSYFEDMVKALE